MIEVQASVGINGSPHLLKSVLTLNTSTPVPSQVSGHTLTYSQAESEGTASATAITSILSNAPAAKVPVAAKQDGTVATNDTASGAGKTGALAELTNCGNGVKRSWTFRGRIAPHLHVRGCVVPIALEPANALVPDPDTPSEPENQPQPASSPEPQVAKVSQQINNQQTDSHQADVQQTDTQPAGSAPKVESEPATLDEAPLSINSPIIVQGQTVPATGDSITVNNQPVKVSSGYIYVGTKSAPIPQVQVTPLHAQPIVAGPFTFYPASPTPVPQVEPSPFVVGDLTFSAAESKPSSESNIPPDQPQARPVVVGGKLYAPIAPSSQLESSQAAGNQPEQGSSEPSNSQVHSDNADDNSHSAPDESNHQAAQVDSKPIVIGGITYTPATASATPSPQHPSVFSFRGTALTQGGEPVTISGTRVSLGQSGIVIGTSSLSFSTATPTRSLLTIGSETLTALHDGHGGFEIGHSTILPGSSGVAISGTTYSINKAGSLVVGTSTIPLATADISNVSDSALTAGGETFTPLGKSAVVVNGTTISIGGPAITEHGTRLSLAPNGLVVGLSTFAYATPVANTATTSTAAGTFSTGVLPSGGYTPAAIPSATGTVFRSTASVKTLTPGVMIAFLGLSISLIM